MDIKDLRRKAAARLSLAAHEIDSLNAEQRSNLLHELHTHQIELELQNEELRNTEQELLQARNRYSDLYDLAPVAYLTINSKGLILEANLTAAEMLKVERGLLLNSPLSAFIHSQTQDIYYLFMSSISKNYKRQHCELRLQQRGKAAKENSCACWVQVNARPVPLGAAEIQHIHLSLSDISARKKAEEKLQALYEELESRIEQRTAELTLSNQMLSRSTQIAEQAARSKSDFLASMSHEIRTPLNGVLGVADLLEHTELNAQQQHYVDVIKRSGTTLMTVINDILVFSKIEAGKLELELSSFSLSQFIKEALEPFRLLPASQVELMVECDPAIPDWLIGDKSRLNQVLVNLLSNAFKFTHRVQSN